MYVITMSERKMGFHLNLFIFFYLIRGLLTHNAPKLLSLAHCMFRLRWYNTLNTFLTQQWQQIYLLLLFISRSDVSVFFDIATGNEFAQCMKHLTFFFRFILLTYFIHRRCVLFSYSSFFSYIKIHWCTICFVQYRTKQTIRLFMCVLDVKIRVFFDKQTHIEYIVVYTIFILFIFRFSLTLSIPTNLSLSSSIFFVSLSIKKSNSHGILLQFTRLSRNVMSATHRKLKYCYPHHTDILSLNKNQPSHVNADIFCVLQNTVSQVFFFFSYVCCEMLAFFTSVLGIFHLFFAYTWIFECLPGGMVECTQHSRKIVYFLSFSLHILMKKKIKQILYLLCGAIDDVLS